MWTLDSLADVDWLEHRAAVAPDVTALQDGGRRLTWADWHARSSALAERMRELPDGPVALSAARADVVAVALGAAMKARRLLVPFNPRWSALERAAREREVDAAGLLVERGEMADCAGMLLECDLPAPLRVRAAAAAVTGLDGLVCSADRCAELLESWSGPGAGERPVLGLFTSGTTGTPKLAQLSPRALVASALAGTHALGVRGSVDTWAACMPLYHVGGLSILVRAMVRGLTVVVVAPQVEALSAASPSYLSLVPTVLQRVVAAGVRAPESLRATLVGGGPASGELLRAAAHLGWKPRFSYGMTETAAHMTLANEASALAGHRSVGWPIAGVALSLRNVDGDGVGEFVVRGPTLMLGYRGREPIVDAFVTGDAGRLDAGWGYELVDRRSDLIVSGGENVYPQQVEDALTSHPGVAAAAVVGVPDEEWGERVAAVVELRDPAVSHRAMERWVRERVAGFAVPRVWLVVDELPRTTTGKVQRARSRSLLLAHRSGDGADVDPGDAEAE